MKLSENDKQLKQAPVVKAKPTLSTTAIDIELRPPKPTNESVTKVSNIVEEVDNTICKLSLKKI